MVPNNSTTCHTTSISQLGWGRREPNRLHCVSVHYQWMFGSVSQPWLCILFLRSDTEMERDGCHRIAATTITNTASSTGNTVEVIATTSSIIVITTTTQYHHCIEVSQVRVREGLLLIWWWCWGSYVPLLWAVLVLFLKLSRWDPRKPCIVTEKSFAFAGIVSLSFSLSHVFGESSVLFLVELGKHWRFCERAHQAICTYLLFYIQV